MSNPLNPLNWVKSAQDWFSRTEKSSGFRPYLIFLILHIGLVIILLIVFPNSEVTNAFAVYSLYFTFGAFVLLFAAKAFQDPDFCRSEKHIENVKRIEMMEEKGDPGPQPIDIDTTEVISSPAALLPSAQDKDQ